MSQPVYVRFEPASYSVKGTPCSGMRIQFSISANHFWEITADYSKTHVYLQLSQLKLLLGDLDTIIASEPDRFNGTVVVSGLLGVTYDLLRGLRVDYSVMYLVRECLDLVNTRSVTLGISAD